MIRTYGSGITMKGAPLKILLLDGIKDRASGFTIHGTNWILCRCELDELCKTLVGENWDLVVISSYFGTGGWEPLLPVPSITEAFQRGRIKGVMLITPVAADGLRQYNTLQQNKVPVVYYPFNHEAPSTHMRVDL